MAIARDPAFVIDCPDARALADFYAALLGWEVRDPGPQDVDGWIDVSPTDGTGCISFQRVADYRAPRWPGQEHPQQMHLDVVVDDLDAGQAAVLELGASLHEVQPGTSFRVFLDPAGHPFCLCAA